MEEILKSCQSLEFEAGKKYAAAAILRDFSFLLEKDIFADGTMGWLTLVLGKFISQNEMNEILGYHVKL